jgi:UDP-glucose 4-epimerase
MQEHAGAFRFNLGSDTGYSVLEVVEAARRVTGKDIKTQSQARRAGDPPALVASSKAAREALDWRPDYDDIDSIVESAWRWHRAARY